MRTILLLIFMTLAFVQVEIAFGTFVTEEDVHSVAEGWISTILRDTGSWGGVSDPSVEYISKITVNGRNVGYEVGIQPIGFIVTSCLKELPPIVAFSDHCDLVIQDNNHLLLFELDSIMQSIELEFGSIADISQEELMAFTQRDNLSLWEKISSGGVISKSAKMTKEGRDWDYFLESNWDQGPPYNIDCPGMEYGIFCQYSGYPFPEYHESPAGCNAIASSQVMKHWSWPPYDGGTLGSFDWNVLKNKYDYSYQLGAFVDEHGDLVTQYSLDEVAELCADVANNCGTTFSCEGSSAVLCHPLGNPGEDVLDVFEDRYFYSDWADCQAEHDSDPFENIIDDIDSNRPVLYGVPGHTCVVDGYQIVVDPPDIVGYVHVNWATDYVSPQLYWWTIDYLIGLGPALHAFFVRHLQPMNTEGSVIEQGDFYPSLFGIDKYKYFNMNCIGFGATYNPGYAIQFLAGVKATCNGPPISFLGSPAFVTDIYSVSREHACIRVHQGELKLNLGGGVKLN